MTSTLVPESVLQLPYLVWWDFVQELKIICIHIFVSSAIQIGIDAKSFIFLLLLEFLHLGQHRHSFVFIVRYFFDAWSLVMCSFKGALRIECLSLESLRAVFICYQVISDTHHLYPVSFPLEMATLATHHLFRADFDVENLSESFLDGVDCVTFFALGKSRWKFVLHYSLCFVCI